MHSGFPHIQGQSFWSSGFSVGAVSFGTNGEAEAFNSDWGVDSLEVLSEDVTFLYSSIAIEMMASLSASVEGSVGSTSLDSLALRKASTASFPFVVQVSFQLVILESVLTARREFLFIMNSWHTSLLS